MLCETSFEIFVACTRQNRNLPRLGKSGKFSLKHGQFGARQAARPKTQLLLEKVMSSFPNELVWYTLEWNISWPHRIDATAHVTSSSLTLFKNNFHCVARLRTNFLKTINVSCVLIYLCLQCRFHSRSYNRS